ncbi:MAG TPA: Stp1/IreP family PP2C-type Ser/Thr phosphatase [Gaiellaceae bacterium]|nr:Stp1/IreP family PP2C-type Ser/Thr phosphatase [Gaiellaceae bacterium]
MRIGRAAAVTDTGLQRLRNEDAFVCEPPLFAVADGMGGARAGEVAARLAATALEEAGRSVDDVAGLISEANRRIWERSLTDPLTTGMGTTVTAALVDGTSGAVTIGHVGDSRAYLLRSGALEQLTSDHSLVAELVEGGVLTPEEAERHPQRSAITRALGTEPTVEVDVFTVESAPGDLFLLCSDGLSSMVADETVASVIEGAELDPARAAEALVAAANARGGQDNITVVLFEIVEGDPAEAAPEVTVGTDPAGGPEPTPPGDGARPAAPVSTHGAGKGGRLPALLFVLTVLAIGALLLYWGISR